MSSGSVELRAPDAAPKSGSVTSVVDDDAQLHRLGKRPLLERSFGFMSILGFSCSSLLSWEGILVTSVAGLLNGGPAGVVWGYLVNWVGMMSVYATMAELASIAPTAGGQYHWVAMMAPKPLRNFLAYLTAWLTTLAWQAMAVSTAYIIATLLQGMIILSQGAEPTYVPQNYQTVLILWASMIFAVVMNSMTGRVLAKFEGLVLIFHLAGFFGVFVPLVYFVPHGIAGTNDAATVFTSFLNTGGWSSQGLSFLVGFPQVATSLVGADCAVHMSEEIKSASIVVPRALLYTIFINGLLAFAMILGLLFSITDLEGALDASNTVFYPFLQIFQTAVNSTAGAVAMASVILVMAVASSVGVYASASRIMWSFSRDRGLPFSGLLVRLTNNALPVNCVLVTLTITVLLSLVALGSSVALNALLSLVIAALFSTYLLVIVLLLWRRTTGAIQPYIVGSDSVDADNLAWGPWKLPEPFGVLNNVFASIYCVFLLFWSFWPQYTLTTSTTMNWSVLILGFVVLASIVWWLLRARHYFKGPIREV
ncbi:amino acid/polyamine transporter I [Parachaetomium inaequale]|uniref:Amino acid/polyamine transporter I n=1 Tax=Parachaetomium inaequale TaxID=2588326 RepID=A0AAN6P4G3_9PEZI|nr:amino acid/polyamine transporter I [Parachaetomium inaequale]